MLKALNLRCVMQNHGITITRFTRCNYASKKGQQQNSDNATKDDAPIVPLPMSYNSYEDLSSDPTTPPVIIMHGSYTKETLFNRKCYHFVELCLIFPFWLTGLFGSKQNWRSISKAIHSKSNPTRKVCFFDMSEGYRSSSV